MKNRLRLSILLSFIFIHSTAILDPDFIDLSIFSTQITHVLGDPILNIRMRDSNFTTISIGNFSQISNKKKTVKMKCENNKFVKLEITFTRSDRSVSTLFNASCIKANINSQTNINYSKQVDHKSINISWGPQPQHVTHLLLHYWTKYSTRVSSQIIPIQSGLLSLKDLREKTWYQICTATINIHWITSIFECYPVLTDFSMTGPVTNISTNADSQSIKLSWQLPEYKLDIPQSYIVNLYNNASHPCRSFIINMTNATTNKLIKKNDSKSSLCKWKSILEWQALQTLEIDKLPSFTRFNIDITPINGNKLYVKHSPISIQTKQGESEAVQNLRIELKGDGSIGIEYSQPNQPNGIIHSYRITFSEKLNPFCTNTIQTNNVTHFTNKTKYEIKIENFPKCRSYLVGVNPVNGWHANGGLGKLVLSSFRYSLKQSIISINASFISRNSFMIRMNDFGIINQCSEWGVIAEIINIHNDSECAVRVQAVSRCNNKSAIAQAMSTISNCSNVEFENINNQSHSIDVVFIGNAQYPIKYQWRLFLITDQVQLIHSGIVDNKHLPNCFTDCHRPGLPYSGIVSTTKAGKVCDPWNQSDTYSKKKGTISNICSSIDHNNVWCPSKSSNNLWDQCDVTPCNKITQMTGCVRISASESNSNSLTIHWSKPNYPQKVIGYVTLLHNMSHECEQFNIQLCQKCRGDNLFYKSLTRFYLSCAIGTISNETKYETRFSSLDQNKKFIVYILPIVDSNMIGEIINISIQTKLARPAVPRIIQVRPLHLTTIQLTWMKEINTHLNGPAKYYNISLWKSDSITLYTSVSNESVIITNLEMCTKYCFVLSSGNDAGWSEMSKEKCNITLAPKPGRVEVEDVQSRLSSSFELKWKYLGTDNCDKTYFVEYAIKHRNRSKMAMRTPLTSIRLVNLTTNLIYTVKIRAENLQQTLNKDVYGEYSQTKQFYTGNDQVHLIYFNKTIDEVNQLIHIFWGIPDQLIGSIFEFIILFTDHHQICTQSIDLQCSNCPPPWNWVFLDNEASNEREKLLKICKISWNGKFNFSQDKFSYKGNLTKELFGQSFDIYGISLLRVTKLNPNKITVEKGNTKIHYSAISWSIIICSVAIFMILITILILMINRRSNFGNNYETEAKLTIEETNHNSQLDTPVESPKDLCKLKTSSLNAHIYPKFHKKINHGVKVSEFHKYFENCSKNKSAELIKEYNKLSAESKALEAALSLTLLDGKDLQNAKKNRFVNILPFDQNRVKLKNKRFPDDYINANYIPFNSDENKIEYIASQGPIEGSLPQFWQMIWEQNISCIAMLTQTMEGDKFKCLQYWPDSIHETKGYGDDNKLAVTLLEENNLEGYIERTLSIKNLENDEERTIVHLHMDTWSDYSTPNTEQFNKYLFRFQEVLFTRNYPYLVHCSAGVGRTGTLICIDRLVKQLADNCQEINIYETILKLRQYRNLLVQRSAQYIFIHEYLDSFIAKYLRTEDPEEALYFNEE